MPDEDGNRTLEERRAYMDARGGNARIEQATRIRTERAELKRAIKAGRVDPVALICGELPAEDGWEPVLIGMTVHDVILQVPTFGKITTLDFLADIGLGRDVKFRALTYRVREDIAEHLRLVLVGIPMPDGGQGR